MKCHIDWLNAMFWTLLALWCVAFLILAGVGLAYLAGWLA